MSPTPSDEWLLALLDEKLPEELTPAEFAALRERSTASPAVRRAIHERIRFEESLHSALGQPVVSANQIIRRAHFGRCRRLAGLGLAVLLLAAAGTGWWLARRPNDVNVAGRDDVATAQRTTDGDMQPANAFDGDRPHIAPVEAPRPQTASTPVLVTDLPVPAEVESDEPSDRTRWESVLGDRAPIVPFLQSATLRHGQTVPGYEVVDELTPSALGEWLAAVPGEPFEITAGQWRGQQFAGLEGLARLRPRWRQDSVLRIAPFDVNEFAIHLWNGTQGVTLRYYPQQRPQLLAAYAATRDATEPTPKSVRLLASDGGAYARSNAGAIELRHQEGRLVVTRGTTALLVVPMDAPPGDLLLEGRLRLRALTMYRGERAALSRPTTHRDLLPSHPPDQFDWLVSSEPAPAIEKHNGRVKLSWSAKTPPKSRQIVWAAVPVPELAATGLCEAVFRFESLTPGTGLYLGDTTGRPLQTLFASENDQAGAPSLAFGWTSRNGNGSVPEPRIRRDVDPKHELVPAVGPGSWIKLFVGPGGLKVFVSGDGEHWGPASRTPERSIRGTFGSLGVFAMADDKPRSISVAAVAVRELSGLAATASQELRRRVPAFDPAPPERPADWLTWTTATRPAGASAEEWLRACGVETLARGSSDDVANAVLDGLIRDAIDSQRTVDDVLDLLHDSAIVIDVGRSAEFVDHYENLARRIVERGGPPAQMASELSAVVEGYLSAPLWGDSRLPAVPPGVARNVAAVASWSPEAAAATTKTVAVLTPAHPEGGWTTSEEPGLARLLSWSVAMATGGSRRLDGDVRLGWQHPLATEPGREEMTLATELDSALKAGAFEDAAGLLPALTRQAGLLPALGDSDRYVPAAGLVSEAARQYPKLVATLTKRHGAAGAFRVREAAAAGDAEAIRAAAVRFYGTPAAAEARRWLGDAALANGRFIEAEGHFTAAIDATPAEQKSAIAARKRLAAALAGQESGQPVTEAVTFGSQTLDAAAFERLIADLRQAHSTAALEKGESVAIPEPAAVSPQARGQFDGDVGRNPGKAEFQRFDWAGRQIEITIDRGVFYFTNRFQVVAFDPKRKAAWWTIGLGNEQGDTHARPNVAVRPVIRGERLFVRRLTGRGFELACLGVSAGGKVLWRSAEELEIASDPFFDGDRLFAITTRNGFRGGGLTTLSLTRFRDDDGSVIASEPLLILNNAEGNVCLAPTGDGFILQAQGTLARCGRNGTLAWVRRLPHLPAGADLDKDRVPPAPPLLRGDRLYAAPPGSRAIVCLDAVTGRLLWKRPLGELERLHGRSGPVLVVDSGDALLGLDPESGATRWRFARAGLLDALLSDGETILTTARTELDDKLDGLSLLRLDAATGTPRSEQVVRVQRTDAVRCGPLFIHDGTLWGFVGESRRDAKRTLVEFAADPSLPAIGPADQPGPLAGWLSHVEATTVLNTAAVLPGWTAIGSQSPRRSGSGAGFLDEQRGEKWVLATEAGRDRAARFVKQVSLPDGKPKLVARVGRDDDEGWTLRLMIDGKPFASEPINQTTAPDGWRTVTFDLTPLADSTFVLAVDQSAPNGERDKTTRAFWKSLQIE